MGFEVYPEKDDTGKPTGAQAWRMTESENQSTIAIGGEGFTTADHAERAIANVMLRAQELLHPGTYKRVELTTRRGEMLEYLQSTEQIKRVAE